MNKEDFDDLVDSWIHGFVADNQTEEAMRFITIALLWRMKMANTKIAYQEIRIDVRHPELTEVYVYVENLSRDGFPVEGWHHKTFPASMSSIQILQAWAEGKEDPVMWSFKVPPTFLERMDELNNYQRNIYTIEMK